MRIIIANLVVLFLLPASALAFQAANPVARRQAATSGGLQMMMKADDDDADMMNSNSSSSRRAFFKAAGALGAASLLTTASIVPTAAAANAAAVAGGKIVYGNESIMSPKEHGTSSSPVQSDLRYGVSTKLADRITNYNRHFAEMGGYFESTNWKQVVLDSAKQQDNNEPITFYDSVTGKPLFVAPIGRTAQELVAESEVHGWPSFRDSEVVWDNVRVLRDGETVSVTGTHLGHNLPDRSGNRYCINLVSIAGNPTTTESASS